MTSGGLQRRPGVLCDIARPHMMPPGHSQLTLIVYSIWFDQPDQFNRSWVDPMHAFVMQMFGWKPPWDWENHCISLVFPLDFHDIFTTIACMDRRRRHSRRSQRLDWSRKHQNRDGIDVECPGGILQAPEEVPGSSSTSLQASWGHLHKNIL